jgi:chemotaxis protein methyltransferase CheR
LEEQYKIKDNIQNMVQVSLLNLMDHWPMKGPFDVIFCRNVMIYFDTQTQEKLVNRFWDLLPTNGYLFVGNAEGLSRISHKFKYVNPAIYKQ